MASVKIFFIIFNCFVVDLKLIHNVMIESVFYIIQIPDVNPRDIKVHHLPLVY